MTKIVSMSTKSTVTIATVGLLSSGYASGDVRKLDNVLHDDFHLRDGESGVQTAFIQIKTDYVDEVERQLDNVKDEKPPKYAVDELEQLLQKYDVDEESDEEPIEDWMEKFLVDFTNDLDLLKQKFEIWKNKWQPEPAAVVAELISLADAATDAIRGPDQQATTKIGLPDGSQKTIPAPSADQSEAFVVAVTELTLDLQVIMNDEFPFPSDDGLRQSLAGGAQPAILSSFMTPFWQQQQKKLENSHVGAKEFWDNATEVVVLVAANLEAAMDPGVGESEDDPSGEELELMAVIKQCQEIGKKLQRKVAAGDHDGQKSPELEACMTNMQLAVKNKHKENDRIQQGLRQAGRTFDRIRRNHLRRLKKIKEQALYQ